MSGVPEGRLRFFPASQSLFQKPLSWGRLPAGQSPAGWKPAPRRLLEQTLNRPSGTQSQNVPVPVPALKGWAILNCPSGTKGRTTWDALNVRISSVCPQKPILERGWGLEMKERTDLCAVAETTGAEARPFYHGELCLTCRPSPVHSYRLPCGWASWAFPVSVVGSDRPWPFSANRSWSYPGRWDRWRSLDRCWAAEQTRAAAFSP